MTTITRIQAAIPRRIALASLTALLLASGACASAPSDREIVSVIDSFYGAMKKGDRGAAMSHIAPDAVFLESGRLETRSQYENDHLPGDIEFERQVAGKRGPIAVKFNGDTAWASALSEYDGVFNGSPVAFTGAQLVVLTKIDGTWKIRSIHWSSRRR